MPTFITSSTGRFTLEGRKAQLLTGELLLLSPREQPYTDAEKALMNQNIEYTLRKDQATSLSLEEYCSQLAKNIAIPFTATPTPAIPPTFEIKSSPALFNPVAASTRKSTSPTPRHPCCVVS